MKYHVLTTISLLSSALALPQTEFQSSITGTELPPLTELTIANSRSFVTLTGTSTANATASGESAIPTTVAATTAAPAGTSIAIFTVPNGGIYTASLISSIAQIAGFRLSAGGQGAFVGGVQVSVAPSGILEGGQIAPFNAVTGSEETVVASTSTAASGSSATVVSVTTTAAVAASTGSVSSVASSSAVSAASGSGSAPASASTSSSAAGGVATTRPKSAVAALGGVAGLLCLFG